MSAEGENIDRPTVVNAPSSRDEAYWAKPVRTLDVRAVPADAVNANVAGRRVAGGRGNGPDRERPDRLGPVRLVAPAHLAAPTAACSES